MKRRTRWARASTPPSPVFTEAERFIALRSHYGFDSFFCIPGTLQAAMTTAISSGVLDPQVVVIDARRRAGGRAAPVTPIGALYRYDRPTPALTAYD